MNGVSFVVPTLNEAERLPALLADLAQVAAPSQVIVADGGSSDSTLDTARRCGATVVSGPAGRARQMNQGATVARHTWLCFLHADVRLPGDARQDLFDVCAHDETDAAVWRLAIEAPNPLYRVIEIGARLRDRWLRLPYGDQGLLVRRSVFRELGGFPDVPLMEDVSLNRSISRRTRLRRMPHAIRVSPRRWERGGIVRGTLRNVTLIGAFLVGVSPHRLARWYPRAKP